MESKLIAGKTLVQWQEKFPNIKDIIDTKETFWINPNYEAFTDAVKKISLTTTDIRAAEDRLQRFAPFIINLFPESSPLNGLIESPLLKIPTLQQELATMNKINLPGQLLLKCDNQLAIAGSIKARGGIYEVLKHTEDLALAHGLLTINDNYAKLADEKYRSFFNQHTIQVGSTGNLGLSIGIMSAKIGFKVIVHMSADAKQWKKDLLRSKGVTVVEYASDYSNAVKAGRKLSDADPMSYFVDDENSTNLFLGYAVAAGRLKTQLDTMNIVIDENHPLFVYLPCGVGGAPGGVAFGLKLLFKDNVHCFFAEPTHSPCMLLGMLTNKHDSISVQDFGIDNITEADGLAVGKPSGFIGKTLENLLSGIYTIDDDALYILLSTLINAEKIYLEPSAAAGLSGIVNLFKNKSAIEYVHTHHLTTKMANATHIAWATGGSLVPSVVMDEYYSKGLSLLSK